METQNAEYKIIKEEITYEEDEEGNRVKVITRNISKTIKYNENVKKAIYKYRENNKEKINNHLLNRYHTDEEYREKVKQRRR